MTDKKRVLVLQHIHDDPAGRVGSILDEYEVFYHLIHVGRDHLPDPIRYDAIVVLGGAAHLYDSHRYPYSVHEEAYLQQAIKQGVPYLGMCLGGQLLAKAFQGEVKKLPKYHIGFLKIRFSEAGKQDPLFQGFESYQLTFQWHADCFLLPEGAVGLAHHTEGFNQAFRYGERAYGVQFHIELTEDLLDLWLHEPGMKKEFIELYGHEAYEKTERDAVDLYPTYAQHSTRMLKNYFKLSEVI
jgi:GMP synthase-like glutamine amidotransferase